MRSSPPGATLSGILSNRQPASDRLGVGAEDGTSDIDQAEMGARRLRVTEDSGGNGRGRGRRRVLVGVGRVAARGVECGAEMCGGL